MSERTFRLYDTLTGTLKPLELVEPNVFKFYSCGPTVYSYAHIGNFRTFITGDLIVRTAKALGWDVQYVSNITDVGHLTQDDVADAGGDDKMQKALQSKEGEAFANVWDLAQHYSDAFKADWDMLRLTRPMVWPRATQHMREQIVAIEKLIEEGHAYVTASAVYFRLSSFPEHGKLSGNTNKDDLRVAVRDVVQDPEKEHPGDFALWKRDDKHLMQWFSPWGWGFPGWHIECSVMAMMYLGDTLDLHAGGEDLIFPHHESEIAQSECLTKKLFSKHWLHTRFLQVDGEKMSKSKGNFYTVRDLVEDRNEDPIGLRIALMAVPYSKSLNFTMTALADATRTAERFRECRRIVSKRASSDEEQSTDVTSELARLGEEVLDALCDDLNTSVALAKAYEGTSVIFREAENLGGSSLQAATDFLNRVDELLGIAPLEEEVNSGDELMMARIEGLIADRQQARADRDFARADEIRTEIEELGYELRDTPDGPIAKKKFGEKTRT